MSNEMILLVYTSGHAFSIEKALTKCGVSCRLTPIPRGISSDCGICLRFPAEDEAAVKALLGGLSFEVQGIVPSPESNDKTKG